MSRHIRCSESLRMIDDGRTPLQELYGAYASLLRHSHWEGQVIHEQTVLDERGEPLGISLPILMLQNDLRGKSLWILAGIHGEEPAGPIALAEHINVLRALHEQNVPVVLLPLCNPSGYARDWRYPNLHRSTDPDIGRSVGDSDHCLVDGANQPRKASAACPESQALTSAVIDVAKTSPPHLVFDLHEDEVEIDGDPLPCLYVHGDPKKSERISGSVVELLRQHGVELQMEGTTRFGERIEDGIVMNYADGSIDELLAADRVYTNNRVQEKSPAQTVIVLETRKNGWTLRQRVATHAAIVKALPDLWEASQNQR